MAARGSRTQVPSACPRGPHDRVPLDGPRGKPGGGPRSLRSYRYAASRDRGSELEAARCRSVCRCPCDCGGVGFEEATVERRQGPEGDARRVRRHGAAVRGRGGRDGRSVPSHRTPVNPAHSRGGHRRGPGHPARRRGTPCGSRAAGDAANVKEPRKCVDTRGTAGRRCWSAGVTRARLRRCSRPGLSGTGIEDAVARPGANSRRRHMQPGCPSDVWMAILNPRSVSAGSSLARGLKGFDLQKNCMRPIGGFASFSRGCFLALTQTCNQR